MDLRALIRSTMEEPPALFNSDGSHYKEVKGDYRKIRLHLNSELSAGQTLGIRLPKGPSYFLCILACMELGITYIPLNVEFPESRIKEIEEDAKMQVIVDDAYLHLMLAREKSLSLESDSPTRLVQSETPLYVIFTSGSTGRPKGVVISRGAFSAYYQWLTGYLEKVQSHDKVLQVTEFTFDISLIDLVLYLTKKTPLYFSSFSGVIFKLAKEISDHKITVLSTVPNNINMLLSDFVVSKSDFSSIKTLMIGGARFSYGLYQKVFKHLSDRDISNFYGPTEFTIYSHAKKITFNESKDCFDHNVSIGSPNNGINAEIYSEGKFCKENERGELILSGKQIMNGYINNMEKTSEVIIDVGGIPFYKTGDLAYKNSSNEFFVVGRFDDTIKYRGYRINLLDIDSYIARLAYVQDVTTIAVPDEIKENVTVSFIILKLGENEPVTEQEIKRDLREMLVDYQIPEKIKFISEFPINVSGKVCKNKLLNLYLKK